MFVNQLDEGVTPLHISVTTGDEAMVKLLHSFKANASIPDKVPAYQCRNLYHLIQDFDTCLASLNLSYRPTTRLCCNASAFVICAIKNYLLY